MTKNATKDIIQNYLKENPQLLPFSDKTLNYRID